MSYYHTLSSTVVDDANRTSEMSSNSPDADRVPFRDTVELVGPPSTDPPRHTSTHPIVMCFILAAEDAAREAAEARELEEEESRYWTPPSSRSPSPHHTDFDAPELTTASRPIPRREDSYYSDHSYPLSPIHEESEFYALHDDHSQTHSADGAPYFCEYGVELYDDREEEPEYEFDGCTCGEYTHYQYSDEYSDEYSEYSDDEYSDDEHFDGGHNVNGPSRMFTVQRIMSMWTRNDEVPYYQCVFDYPDLRSSTRWERDPYFPPSLPTPPNDEPRNKVSGPSRVHTVERIMSQWTPDDDVCYYQCVFDYPDLVSSTPWEKNPYCPPSMTPPNAPLLAYEPFPSPPASECMSPLDAQSSPYEPSSSPSHMSLADGYLQYLKTIASHSADAKCSYAEDKVRGSQSRLPAGALSPAKSGFGHNSQLPSVPTNDVDALIYKVFLDNVLRDAEQDFDDLYFESRRA